MSKSDHYSVLGVQRNASIETIKAAYHKLAIQYHPDKHTDNPLQELAEARFKEIQEAYKTLSNAKLRRRYDASMPGYTAGHSEEYHPAAVNSDDEGRASGGSSEEQVVKERKPWSSAAWAFAASCIFGSAGIIYFLWQVICYSQNGYWTKRSVIDVAAQVIGSQRLLIPWDWFFGLYRLVYRILGALSFALFLILISVLILLVTLYRKTRPVEDERPFGSGI